MSFTRKVAHNTIYQAVGKIIATILGVLAIAMMTRYLGQTGFGQYSTIIAFLQFFGIMVDMGLTLITVQMISSPGADEPKIIGNLFTLRFFSAVVFLALAPVIALLTPYPAIIKIGIALTAFHFLLISMTQILIGVFQRHLSTGRAAIAEVIGRIFLLVGIGLAIYLGQGILWIMGAVILGSLANFLAGWWLSIKFVRIKFLFDWPIWKKIITLAWPVGISIIFNLIYLKADTLILSFLRPANEVGLYGAPYRVLEILVTFPYMFVGLVMPALTYNWAQNQPADFKKIIQKSFDLLSLLAVPLMVGTYFLGRPIMTLVAGPEFLISGDILKILMVACCVIFLGVLFGHAVVAINKQKQMIFGYLATAVVALIGYLIFIPKYSYWGAAWMTVVSESMIALITFLVVYKYTKIAPNLKVLGKAILASLIMALPLYFFNDYNLLLLISVAAFIYLAAIYLLKAFTRETVMEIFRLKEK
ncbi:MAG: flippase [bacterium]